MNTPTRAVRNHTRLCAALSAIFVAAGLLAASPVAAVTKNVVASDDRTFTPQTISSAVGGSIHWTASGVDDHSVHQNSNVFDSGNPAPGLDFTLKFSAGTFPYLCEEHGDRGMRGTVRVAPQTLSAPAGLNFTVKWASAGTDTGTRFDVMYRVGSGAWKTWRNNTSARSMVFGGGAGPVAVARGKSYSFKVRSGQGTGSIQSGFSPVKSFRAG
jgi:plastocyanin